MKAAYLDILSPLGPLLFLIFFADAVSGLECAHVRDVIMLGSFTLSAILFADDVLLLARLLVDLQPLLDAFSNICSHRHEQIALDGGCPFRRSIWCKAFSDTGWRSIPEIG